MREIAPAIAISGRAGAGKSSLAKLLVSLMCDDLGIPAVRMAFADKLKQEVYDLYGITKEMVGGRDVLIRHGEANRLRDPDYYIRPVAERLRLAQICGVVSVVDDMRFMREYEWARMPMFRGGRRCLTVRVVAPMAWREQRLNEQGLFGGYAYSDAASETELSGVPHDMLIKNGRNESLEDAAWSVLNRLSLAPKKGRREASPFYSSSSS